MIETILLKNLAMEFSDDFNVIRCLAGLLSLFFDMKLVPWLLFPKVICFKNPQYSY